jgi:hypothetical protein
MGIIGSGGDEISKHVWRLGGLYGYSGPGILELLCGVSKKPSFLCCLRFSFLVLYMSIQISSFLVHFTARYVLCSLYPKLVTISGVRVRVRILLSKALGLLNTNTVNLGYF